VPQHSAKVFVERVDYVCGLGYDRAAQLGAGGRFHRIGRVVTNLAVLDFDTPDRSMRVASLHPGVTLADVQAKTGFALATAHDVPTTRAPTDEELQIIRALDPDGRARKELA
jgi:acyl CoA:acetate/3-ketoacid CoA transferase beta subunit